MHINTFLKIAYLLLNETAKWLPQAYPLILITPVKHLSINYNKSYTVIIMLLLYHL